MNTKPDAADLQAFLRDHVLNGRDVGVDEDLLLSGLVDSLAVMALVEFIEETREATIPPEDITLENFATITAILAYLNHEQA